MNQLPNGVHEPLWRRLQLLNQLMKGGLVSANLIEHAEHQEDYINMMKWRFERIGHYIDELEEESSCRYRPHCRYCPGDISVLSGSHHDPRCPGWAPKPVRVKPELDESLRERVRKFM